MIFPKNGIPTEHMEADLGNNMPVLIGIEGTMLVGVNTLIVPGKNGKPKHFQGIVERHDSPGTGLPVFIFTPAMNVKSRIHVN